MFSIIASDASWLTSGVLLAVTHEHISPTVHHVTEEQITREIHNYDVYHRVLPVIETVVLPTKHYVRELDGSITEIPESMLSQFNIVKSVHSRQIINEPSGGNATSSSGASWTVPLPTLQPNLAYSIRTHSACTSLNRSVIEPSAASKLQPPTPRATSPEPMSSSSNYSSQNSSPRGTAVPAANYQYYSSDDESAIQTGAEKTEGDLLFRNSGYGHEGMLPGLAELDLAPTTQVPAQTPWEDAPTTPRSAESPVGEATLGLRRLKGKFRGQLNDGSWTIEKGTAVTGVEDEKTGLV